MKRYRGNQKVHSGVYFNLQEISFKSIDREGRLPGTDQEEYLRVPTLALLIAGPILGGVYVIFLPLIGLAMLAWLAVGKIVELAGYAAEAAVRVLRPAWEPGWAFLSRGKPAKRAKKKSRDRWAENVKRKLQ
jgi:hypothetical protein